MKTYKFIIFLILLILISTGSFILLDSLIKPMKSNNIEMSVLQYYEEEYNTPITPLPQVPGQSKIVTPVIYADKEVTKQIQDVLNKTNKTLVNQIDEIIVLDNMSEVNNKCLILNLNETIGCNSFKIRYVKDNKSVSEIEITKIYIVKPEFWNQWYRMRCYSFEMVLNHEIGHTFGRLIDDYTEQFADNYARTMTKNRGIC